MAVGGDIIEATFNHPTLGSGTFEIKSGEDMKFDLGGTRTDDDASSVSGTGKTIKKINRKRWMVEGTIVWEMVDEDTLETLSALAGDPIDSEWTFTHINDAVYSGEGNPVGDVQGATQDVSIPIKISGGGRLAQI